MSGIAVSSPTSLDVGGELRRVLVHPTSNHDRTVEADADVSSFGAMGSKPTRDLSNGAGRQLASRDHRRLAAGTVPL